MDKFIKKDNNSHIVWSILKETFLDWFSENKGNKFPLTKNIKEYFEKNIFMEEEKFMTIDKKSYRGWRYYKLTKNV